MRSHFPHFRQRLLERYGLDITPEEAASLEVEICARMYPQVRVRNGVAFLVEICGLRVLVVYRGELVTALPLEAKRPPPVHRPPKRCPYCRIRQHAQKRGVKPPLLPACH